MRIHHKELEVYESGTLNSLDLSDFKFVLSEKPLMEVVCQVVIDGGAPNIKLEAISDYALALVFSNPNVFGFGPKTPVKVGSLNGRSVYVSFRITMRGDNDSYGLDYTFYLGEEINV